MSSPFAYFNDIVFNILSLDLSVTNFIVTFAAGFISSSVICLSLYGVYRLNTRNQAPTQPFTVSTKCPVFKEDPAPESMVVHWYTAVGDILPKFETSVSKPDTRPSSPSLHHITYQITKYSTKVNNPKVTLLVLFDTTCCVCLRQALPMLQSRLSQRLLSKHFSLLLIGRSQTIQALSKFRETFYQNFHIALTLPLAEDRHGSIFKKFAPSIVPRFILIDTEGYIIFQSAGFDSKQFLELLEFIDDELLIIDEYNKKKLLKSKNEENCLSESTSSYDSDANETSGTGSSDGLEPMGRDDSGYSQSISSDSSKSWILDEPRGRSRKRDDDVYLRKLRSEIH